MKDPNRRSVRTVMFKECNETLQRIRTDLVELIAELSLVLDDDRAARANIYSNDGEDGQDRAPVPDYVRRLTRQRDVLVTVASMLADMRFERGRDPQHSQEVSGGDFSND